MIPQALSLGSMLLQVATNFGAGKKGVEEAKKIIDGASATYNVLQTGNLAKSASKTLISPLVAIEDTLIHQDYMSDLMTVINLRDINDVLSHFAQQGRVDGIKVSDLVESIQPRRAGFLSLQGAESFGLSQSAITKKRMKELEGLEAKPVPTGNGKFAYEGNPNSPVRSTVNINGKQVADLQEYKPLAVGRTVDAQVNINGVPLTFPLTFRQTPVTVTANDLQNIFEAARPQDGWFARVMMAKTGEITPPELLTGEDEIKREFQLRRNDLSGYYNEVTDRATKNTMAAMRTGVISLNSEANTIIMSSSTARNIELELGVRFDGSGINKIRQSVKANTIVVVDDSIGLFVFYYAGNNIPEEWTKRQITVASKKDTSMDLTSLAKLFGGR